MEIDILPQRSKSYFRWLTDNLQLLRWFRDQFTANVKSTRRRTKDFNSGRFHYDLQRFLQRSIDHVDCFDCVAENRIFPADYLESVNASLSIDIETRCELS